VDVFLSSISNKLMQKKLLQTCCQ